MCAKSLHSCPILCDPLDCSLPGFSVHGIFQARVLEWVPLPSPSFIIIVAHSYCMLLLLIATLWSRDSCCPQLIREKLWWLCHVNLMLTSLTLCNPMNYIAHQASHPPPSPRACSNSCPLSHWCHPTNWPSCTNSIYIYTSMYPCFHSGTGHFHF